MLKIILATRNLGKIVEIKERLKHYPVRIESLADYPHTLKISENGRTFCENAIIKAKAVAEWLQLPSLADDSGLEIDALDGKPGIFSSRWGKTDQERINRVIHDLEHTAPEQRNARFICAMSFVIPRKNSYLTTGTCPGRIILSPQGKNGFGYDPIFIPEGYEYTFAQLGEEMKNQISHRAIALRKMIQNMVKHYQWQEVD